MPRLPYGVCVWNVEATFICQSFCVPLDKNAQHIFTLKRLVKPSSNLLAVLCRSRAPGRIKNENVFKETRKVTVRTAFQCYSSTLHKMCVAGDIGGNSLAHIGIERARVKSKRVGKISLVHIPSRISAVPRGPISSGTWDIDNPTLTFLNQVPGPCTLPTISVCHNASRKRNTGFPLLRLQMILDRFPRSELPPSLQPERLNQRTTDMYLALLTRNNRSTRADISIHDAPM